VVAVRSEQTRGGWCGLYSTASPPAVWTVIRLIERVVAAAALVGLSPALALLGGMLALTSRASPLVVHERVGQHGRTLWVPKLRTMRRGATSGPSSALMERLPEAEVGVPYSKSRSDPRILGSLARVCRRFSIDELPQLFLVAQGRMSLVGPRPLTRSELETHYGYHADTVLIARPGLTGLWQTNGRNRLTYRQRLQMDLTLVRGYTVGCYFRILARTPLAVVRGEGAC
jgi:exopolysaccharide production protein ExoY